MSVSSVSNSTTNLKQGEICPEKAYFQIANFVASGDSQLDFFTTSDLTIWSGIHKIVACCFVIFDLVALIFVGRSRYVENKTIRAHNQKVFADEVKAEKRGEMQKKLLLGAIALGIASNYFVYNYRDQIISFIKPYAAEPVIQFVNNWYDKIDKILEPGRVLGAWCYEKIGSALHQ